MRKLPSALNRTGTSGGALAARAVLTGGVPPLCARPTMTKVAGRTLTTRINLMIFCMVMAPQSLPTPFTEQALNQTPVI